MRSATTGLVSAAVLAFAMASFGARATEGTAGNQKRLVGPCWIEPSGNIVIETALKETDGTVSIVRVVFGPGGPSHGILKHHIESHSGPKREIWCPWPSEQNKSPKKTRE